MELDGRGIRIDHNQPLRMFLTNLPDQHPARSRMLAEACNVDVTVTRAGRDVAYGDEW